MTDRLEVIKTKWNIPATRPMNVPHGKDDVAWLVSEVERLRPPLDEGVSIVRDYSPGHDVWISAALAALNGKEKP